MSGTLGQAVIAAHESCKIYTNSSGNAASITIHAQATSVDNNACLSFKYSATDACVLCSTTVSTLDIPPTITGNISVNSGGTALCGFTKTESVCALDRSFAWCDVTDTTLYKRNECVCLSCWCAIGDGFLQPSKASHFGAGIQCNPKNNMRWSGITQQMQMNHPSFITGAGEAWEKSSKNNYFVPCCTVGCHTCAALGAFVRFGQETVCCCHAFCGSRDCKRRFFYCGYICHNACCEDYSCHSCQHAWYSQDIWSNATPIFTTGSSSAGMNTVTQCQEFKVRFVNDLTTGSSTTVGGSRCHGPVVNTQCDRAQYHEQCQCCGCCCCELWQKSTHAHRKYVMAGCDVAFFPASYTEGPTAIVQYPNSSTQNHSDDCQLSRFCSMQQFCCFGNQASACCAFYPMVVAMSSSTVKWLWYNPYTDCNYFEIMGTSATNNTSSPADGIYSIDSEYSPNGAGCIFGGTYSSCCKQCKTMADWISAGFIKCISGTPTAWSEKSCYLEVSSQPQLVAKCCFAIWKQCFTFGDLSSGWNGCMTQYRSSDLITWEKITTDLVEIEDVSSGDTLCTNMVKSNGADFFFKTNHYFNASNCINNTGTLEFKTSANRLERTGIVLSNSDKLYVSNNSGTPIAVQVWGYDE